MPDPSNEKRHEMLSVYSLIFIVVVQGNQHLWIIRLFLILKKYFINFGEFCLFWELQYQSQIDCLRVLVQQTV